MAAVLSGFCAKYRHPPRDRDSLDPFLQKLTQKGQSLESQKRAAWSVKKYHDLMESWRIRAGVRRETHGECGVRFLAALSKNLSSVYAARSGWSGRLRPFRRPAERTQSGAIRFENALLLTTVRCGGHCGARPPAPPGTCHSTAPWCLRSNQSRSAGSGSRMTRHIEPLP